MPSVKKTLDNITLVVVFTILGTLLLGYSWLYFYGMIPILFKFFKMDPHYSFSYAISNPATWANLLLVLVLAFLPRVLIMSLDSLRPNPYRLKGPSEWWRMFNNNRTKFEPIQNSEAAATASEAQC